MITNVSIKDRLEYYNGLINKDKKIEKQDSKNDDIYSKKIIKGIVYGKVYMYVKKEKKRSKVKELVDKFTNIIEQNKYKKYIN